MPGFDINRLRLQNQHLAKPELTQPADIVRWLGAVQAQDYAGAKWALGQRLKGAADRLIEEAFNRGDIIRTHVMRPTWHFLAAEDVRWMLDLSAARIHAGVVHAHRTFGLDEAVFSKATHIITKLLEGGRHITRNEIATALKEGGIATNEQRFIHIMMELELRRLICSGPRQGKQFTYALMDERIPVSLELSRDEALAKLSERY
ncbi:MAG TPA: winged helix DNA-binding domain-containing protein, partial [Mucilaginibacter sp.]|nr:winged helix DNA-binding domain-containing protein [Mucilaginibacter sp.]